MLQGIEEEEDLDHVRSFPGEYADDLKLSDSEPESESHLPSEFEDSALPGGDDEDSRMSDSQAGRHITFGNNSERVQKASTFWDEENSESADFSTFFQTGGTDSLSTNVVADSSANVVMDSNITSDLQLSESDNEDGVTVATSAMDVDDEQTRQSFLDEFLH